MPCVDNLREIRSDMNVGLCIVNLNFDKSMKRRYHLENLYSTRTVTSACTVLSIEMSLFQRFIYTEVPYKLKGSPTIQCYVYNYYDSTLPYSVFVDCRLCPRITYQRTGRYKHTRYHSATLYHYHSIPY